MQDKQIDNDVSEEIEENIVDDSTVDNNCDETPPPNFSEEELFRQVDDKDTARVVADLLKGQRIASVYIDARSGGVFFGKDAHITGDVVGRGQKRQTARHVSEIPVESIVGQVVSKNIEKFQSVYVKPLSYESSEKVLTQSHVLILWGQVHWGKWTSAIHLLSSLHATEIFEVKPDIKLEELYSIKLTPKQGYLIDNLSSDELEQLSSFSINQLSNHFKKHGSYLIITVGNKSSLSKVDLQNWLVIWNDLPNFTQVLEKHLRWYLREQSLIAKASEIMQTDDVQKILSSHLLPGEIDQLAELIAKVARSELKLDEALTHFRAQALQQVENWFETNQEVEKRTFMISLSVLSGASYQAVNTADEYLQSLIKLPSPDKETDIKSVFDSKRSRKVKEACAYLMQGYEETEFGRSPIEIIVLDNPTFQPAVLYYVWHEYDRLRESMVEWLRNLGLSVNFDIRTRAAAAVGELSKYNFGYIKEEIILPWAKHQDKRVRAAAAFALGIPAWEGEFAAQVLGLLHHWSTLRNNWRLGWTAAAAYGGLVGLWFPDAALHDIYNLVQSGDLRLFSALNRSVTNLFLGGYVSSDYYVKVLNALIFWIEQSKTNVITLTGLLIFLNLMLVNQSEASPEAEKLPLILWLAQQDEMYQEKIIVLLRQALNTKSSRDPALKMIQRLLQIVNNESLLDSTIEYIFKNLLRQGSSREKERLYFYLKRWAQDPKEKSIIAEQLLIKWDNLIGKES
jgi:hypothetical protein